MEPIEMRKAGVLGAYIAALYGVHGEEVVAVSELEGHHLLRPPQHLPRLRVLLRAPRQQLAQQQRVLPHTLHLQSEREGSKSILNILMFQRVCKTKLGCPEIDQLMQVI